MNFVPLQYATTSDGVRIAYVSHGDGPPIVWASNIFGEAGGSGFGFPHTREVTERSCKAPGAICERVLLLIREHRTSFPTMLIGITRT